MENYLVIKERWLFSDKILQATSEDIFAIYTPEEAEKFIKYIMSLFIHLEPIQQLVVINKDKYSTYFNDGIIAPNWIVELMKSNKIICPVNK